MCFELSLKIFFPLGAILPGGNSSGTRDNIGPEDR